MACETAEQFVASVANAELQQEQHPVSVAVAATVVLLLLPASVAVAEGSHSCLGEVVANKSKTNECMLL